jgi:cadmium resistance protein CadD (predicted permease)
MTSPTPVPVRLRDRLAIYIAIVFMGIPALGIWIYIHLGAIDLICSCVPGDLFPKWAPESSAIGGIFTLLPMLFANWYLWTRWRSYRLAKKVAAEYQEKHNPWYTKTGADRTTGPIINKPYEE